MLSFVHAPMGGQIYNLKGADHGYCVLVESITEGALILSSDDSIYYCNRTLGGMLGLPIQKMISNKLDSFIEPEASLQLTELIRESRSFGAAKGEFLMKSDDGTLLPVNVSLNCMTVEDFEGICAVITDLSEQKRVQEELRRHRTELEFLVSERSAELRQERDTLSALVSSIPDEVWFADIHKKFSLANPSALREFALDPDSDVGIERFAASLEVFRPDGSPPGP